MKQSLISLNLYFVLDYKQQTQQDFTNIFYEINFLSNLILLWLGMNVGPNTCEFERSWNDL